MVRTGFSLIELMVVVVIIGILATLAIPAYHDYTVRARVSEALAFAAAAKTSVSETMIASGGRAPTNNDEAGYDFTAPTTNVANVAVGAKGSVTITTTDVAGNGTFVLIPSYTNGQISWECHRDTLAAKYLPESCRSA